MKGPSLDAIRRFKEAQEKKKQEEDERKIQEKLSTLHHRAAQGDRKAKTKLKRIERINDERTKVRDIQISSSVRPGNAQSNQSAKHGHRSSNGNSKTITRPRQKEADFDELMRLAKQNNNEMRQPEQKKSSDKQPSDKKPIKKICQEKREGLPTSRAPTANKAQQSVKPIIAPQAIRHQSNHRPIESRIPPSTVIHRQSALSLSRSRQYEQESDDEDQDEYEDDGFIVNEEEDEAKEELQRTLKSVFRYDRKRCDLREEELDRQYRAIGKVTTFEDLEREERRAARLAAIEDAKALREEEERKRLKKIRLKKD